MAAKCGVRIYLKPKFNVKLQYHSSIATIIPYIPFLFHLDTIKIDSHSNIRAIWWNPDLVLWPMILKGVFFLRSLSDFDIILTSQDIGLKTCSLSNRLQNIDTEGNDEGLTVTSSSYGTREADHLCAKSFRQSGTSHLFITGCPHRASSEYKDALLTSIMWDVNYISMPYLCTACLSNYIIAIFLECDYI